MTEQRAGRVLVTGGAGFVGSHLVRSYAESGVAVRAIGRSTPPTSAREQAGVEFVQLDLCDLDANLDAFADQDLVIHAAAMLHARTTAERELQRRVNVDATRDVVEACRYNRVPRLIHVSTTATIGISDDPSAIADESSSFDPGDFEPAYSRSKHEAERVVLDADGPDLSTVVVNPGFVFGRHRDGYRGMEVIERVRRRRFVLCTNGGLSVVHVDDVVAGVRRAAEVARNGERYILSGENISFQEIARTVARVSGEPSLVITIPNAARNLAGLYVNSRFGRRRGPGPRRYLDSRYAFPYYSSEKARRELGHEPRSFASIVADALAHERDTRG